MKLNMLRTTSAAGTSVTVAVSKHYCAIYTIAETLEITLASKFQISVDYKRTVGGVGSFSQ